MTDILAQIKSGSGDHTLFSIFEFGDLPVEMSSHPVSQSNELIVTAVRCIKVDFSKLSLLKLFIVMI